MNDERTDRTERAGRRVLVAYATRHGATQEIAERIADRLALTGLEVDCLSVREDPIVSSYDAFVIGSAVYIGQWEKEALAFVEADREQLAERPVWLFSSGPLGHDPLTERGEEKIATAVSAPVLQQLTDELHPREHRVFFGALRPDRLGIGPKVMRLLPAGRKLLEEGDFRDWKVIDAWADEIGGALAPERVPEPATTG
jgi:menaquinone-dependent protoporphyrinogen oxidase